MTNEPVDILLVNPPVNRLCEVAGNFFPLGLGYIAAVTNQRGYKTKIYNAELETDPVPLATNRRRIENQRLFVAALHNEQLKVWQEYREVLESCKPKIVGFSCTSASIAPCLLMAEEARRRGMITVVGGMHPTILPEETARSEAVDYIIAGEAEESFPTLADALLHGRRPDTIPGGGWMQDGFFKYTPSAPLVHNIELLPLPDRDSLIFPERHRPYLGSMVTSRGCPYPCTFCSGKKLHEGKVRYRTVDGIIGEIRLLKERYDVSYITFYDDFMISNRKRMIAICEAMIAADLGVTWGGFSRADSVDEELLSVMKKAGCRYIGMGVESGSDRILERIKKGYSREAAMAGVKMTRNAGINAGITIMVGFPFETAEDVHQTISLVSELNVPTNVNTLTPYPGSEIYDECVKRGLITETGIDWSKISQHSCYNNFIQDIEPAKFRDLLDELISAADFATFRYNHSSIDDKTLRRILEVADDSLLVRMAALANNETLVRMALLAGEGVLNKMAACANDAMVMRMAALAGEGVLCKMAACANDATVTRMAALAGEGVLYKMAACANDATVTRMARLDNIGVRRVASYYTRRCFKWLFGRSAKE